MSMERFGRPSSAALASAKAGPAETDVLVGDALGRGMTDLLASPVHEHGEVRPPVSRTAREIEGWTIRVDDRLLQSPDADLGTRALRFLEAKLVEIKAVVPARRL